jgi:CHAT domain-containing protein/tetratricopeptide (TPR) repeat protein
MRARILTVVFLPVLVSLFAYAQTTPTPKDERRRAQELAAQGQYDQAVLLLKDAAKKASDQGDKTTATEIRLDIAQFIFGMGQREEAMHVLFDALPDASTAGREADVQVSIYLEWARVQAEQDKFMDCLRSLFNVEESLSKISTEHRRLTAQSEELNQRVNLYLNVLLTLQGQEAPKSVGKLPQPVQVFMISAIGNRPPETFEKEPNVMSELVKALDATGPWSEGLLFAARQLNQQATQIDQKRIAEAKNPKMGAAELAKDKSQLARIEELSGKLDEAIRLTNEALQTYFDADSFADEAIELNNLSLLYLRKRSGEGLQEAGKTLSNLVFLVERHATALAGQSMDDFLEPYHSAYLRYYYTNLDFYRATKKDEFLEFALRQADRMNFRATRRDLSVYHDLGEQIVADADFGRRLEGQRKILLDAERDRDRAEEQGKRPEDFQLISSDANAINTRIAQAKKSVLVIPGGGVEVDSPFAAVRLAKQEFVSIVQDVEKQRAQFKTDFKFLTFAEVRQGMSASDGIVMYFRQEPRPPEMYYGRSPSPEDLRQPVVLQAAVITSQQTRMVELNVDVERIRTLVTEARKNISLSGPAATGALGKLAQSLWLPLGTLPEHLTVVLTPDLVGAPFEAFPDANGQPLINRYTIRYAFGLAPGLGASAQPSAYTTALVAGAKDFLPQLGLDPLPASAAEIQSLRQFLGQHGVAVSPAGADGLPLAGRPLLGSGKNFDIVHLSTHSVLDLEVPLLDSLAFPKDQVYAYDLALTPIRAKLVVLSACELFRPANKTTVRDSAISAKMVAKTAAIFPVSGITTASLARIAPLAVSTLWTVSSTASQVFMLRFYDALLAGKEPAAALALTKRDFLHPSQLKAWMKSAGLSIPPESELESYEKPYNWAPFVLVAGMPRD